MNAIIDTDALLGLFDIHDVHHPLAMKLITRAVENGTNIFILPTTLAEFSLLASSRIGMKETQQIMSHLLSSDYLTTDITEEISTESIRLYERQTSKEESLFDCFIMVVAKKLAINYICSFDRGYEKNGFILWTHQ